MSRPIKWRKVEFVPENLYYVPCTKEKCTKSSQFNELHLKIEELEAMRLKDIENLSQEECAKRMEISRQTFQNIIDEGRRKVTKALLEGYSIAIQGGHYTKNICKMRCLNCGSEYERAYEENSDECKSCGSNKIICCANNSCKKCKNNK